MESSSPLAAMHPAPAPGPAWGLPSHSPFAGPGNPFGAARLNIRDQLQRARPEMFDVKAIRGSSPSALAADLSQNFCLDNELSPRFPTPRRALFTSHMGNREFISSPPLPPSSSPRAMQDAMDISPMGQKESFGISVNSSPQASLDDDMMIESPLPRLSSTMPDVSRQLNDSRRGMGIQQPSFTRTTGQPQWFGPGAPALSPEVFLEDSPQERRPQTANSPSAIAPGTSRRQSQFGSLTGTRELRGNASPNAIHARHGLSPFNRPRRQYRRSISMFENPGDVIKGQTGAPVVPTEVQSTMDIGEAQEPILPHFFPDGENDGIPRISCDTFLEFLDGKYNESFTQKVIIDCRFEYEYEGGHIDGAVNCHDKDLLARQLLETPMQGRPILIFHCEYSVHRAPRMARHIRSEDRTVNAEVYPHLTYPEIYILEGGYRDFFKAHEERCCPRAYVEMGAKEHANTCERELGKLQQKRKGLGRAKTFAFGHREPIMFESPTTPGRVVEHPSPSMMIGNSPILGNYRSPARRMASY
ncbi:M-phase inducer phosphatase [Xylaria intraflava]|nr:M-phase inducer phosphatase [Xylaria intraflava]